MLKNIVTVLVGGILLLLIAVYVVPQLKQTGAPFEGAPVACTADAMICPDGSAVGRVGPSCEFAPCPNAREAAVSQ